MGRLGVSLQAPGDITWTRLDRDKYEFVCIDRAFKLPAFHMGRERMWSVDYSQQSHTQQVGKFTLDATWLDAWHN